MSYFKPRNLLLVLALGLALILVVVIALRFRPESQLQALVKALPEGVDVSLQDIDYTHIEEGRARWRLVAQQAERNSASGVLGLINPELKFFDDQGEPKGALSAGKGDVRDVLGLDVAIARVGHLLGSRQIQPELKAAHDALFLLGHLRMNDSPTGGHPLHATVA